MPEGAPDLPGTPDSSGNEGYSIGLLGAISCGDAAPMSASDPVMGEDAVEGLPISTDISLLNVVSWF